MSFCPENRAARRPLNVQDLLGEPIRYDKLSSKEELDSKRHAEAGHPDKPKPAPAKPDPTAELRQRTQGKTLGPSARNEAIDKANDEFSRGVGGLPGKLYAPIGKQLPMRVDNAIRALSPVSLDPNATFEEQAGNLVGGAGAGKAIGAAGRALAPHLGKAASALGDKAAGMVDGVADWMARQRGQVVPSMANSDRINIGRILSESSEEAARRARASERAARKGPQLPTGEPDPVPLAGSKPKFNIEEPPPIPPAKGKATPSRPPSDNDLIGVPDPHEKIVPQTQTPNAKDKSFIGRQIDKIPGGEMTKGLVFGNMVQPVLAGGVGLGSAALATYGLGKAYRDYHDYLQLEEKKKALRDGRQIKRPEEANPPPNRRDMLQNLK